MHSTNRHNRHTNETCKHCGNSYPHHGGMTNCPARGKTCFTCGKQNHFSLVCRHKTGHNHNVRHQYRPQYKSKHKPSHKTNAHQVSHKDEITNNTDDINNHTQPEDYLYACPQLRKKKAMFPVRIQNTLLNAMADTGAGVDIISETDFDKLLPKPNLVATGRRIFTYNNETPLEVIGKFYTTLSFQNCSVNSAVYVVKGSAVPLLSLDTCEQLQLVKLAPQTNPTFANNISTDDICSEFINVFQGIGKLKKFKVKLHIDHNVKPVVQHRREPVHLRQKVKEKLEELLKADIIEEAKGPTPWVSPIVCVPKPGSDDIRLCVDMRAANQAIERERHITPTINEVIADLNGACIFSKLDLNSGYHQLELELEEESRMITTFSTHIGLMCYKRLNFGISSASEVFQNALRQVLIGVPGVINLSDDILVYGKSQKEHNLRLRAVLQKLTENGLTLNKKKCLFNKENVKFFGYIFNKNGISPDPDKIAAFSRTAVPRNASEVRSLLGMAQYLARFIPDFATVVQPLRELTKKDKTWSWGNDEEVSLKMLKERLTDSKTTTYFDPNKDSTISVDASPVGIAAVFTQDGRVVAYASRALSPVEQRYSQTEREALAVLWACQHFRMYILGKHTTLVTDHQPLVKIYNNPQSRPPPRIERWALKLQEYDITVTYSPGSKNPADYMSRHPVRPSTGSSNETEVYTNFVANNAKPIAIPIEKMRTETELDSELQAVMSAIKSGNWSQPNTQEYLNPYKNIQDELSITDNGLLLRGHRLIVPESLRQQAVDLAHGGHQGIVKTKALIREKVWFPGIDRMTEITVSRCIPCQSSVDAKQRAPIKMSQLPDCPWQELSMDFFGPLSNGDYLFVVIDDYSRFPEVEIVKSTSATATIPKLDKILSSYGVPKIIRSDNGPPFNSTEFAKFATNIGFKHRKITPNWPEANGEVERFMRNLKKVIRTANVESRPYKQVLYRFLRSYRATPHSSTGVPPATALFGRNINIGLPEIQISKSREEKKIRKKDETSKERIRQYAERRRHVKDIAIKPGDVVLRKQKISTKSDTPYEKQPYMIMKKKGDMLEATDGQKTLTRNISQFKPIDIPYTPRQIDSELENTSKPCSEDKDTPSIHQNPLHRYPQRVRKPPSYLSDYVRN